MSIIHIRLGFKQPHSVLVGSRGFPRLCTTLVAGTMGGLDPCLPLAKKWPFPDTRQVVTTSHADEGGEASLRSCADLYADRVGAGVCQADYVCTRQ